MRKKQRAEMKDRSRRKREEVKGQVDGGKKN